MTAILCAVPCDRFGNTDFTAMNSWAGSRRSGQTCGPTAAAATTRMEPAVPGRRCGGFYVRAASCDRSSAVRGTPSVATRTSCQREPNARFGIGGVAARAQYLAGRLHGASAAASASACAHARLFVYSGSSDGALGSIPLHARTRFRRCLFLGACCLFGTGRRRFLAFGLSGLSSTKSDSAALDAFRRGTAAVASVEGVGRPIWVSSPVPGQRSCGHYRCPLPFRVGSGAESDAVQKPPRGRLSPLRHVNARLRLSGAGRGGVRGRCLDCRGRCLADVPAILAVLSPLRQTERGRVWSLCWTPRKASGRRRVGRISLCSGFSGPPGLFGGFREQFAVARDHASCALPRG